MLPSRHHRWPAAFALMAPGLPLLVWLFASVGWLAALLRVLAAASVLRWPVIYATR